MLADPFPVAFFIFQVNEIAELPLKLPKNLLFRQAHSKSLLRCHGPRRLDVSRQICEPVITAGRSPECEGAGCPPPFAYTPRKCQTSRKAR